jgi:hypothetical protein
VTMAVDAHDPPHARLRGGAAAVPMATLAVRRLVAFKDRDRPVGVADPPYASVTYIKINHQR